MAFGPRPDEISSFQMFYYRRVEPLFEITMDDYLPILILPDPSID